MTAAAPLEAFAPAKINLFLHVLARRGDGLHALDSLVVFADTGDRLRLDPGPEEALETSGPFAHAVPADAGNLVLRAAREVRAALPGAVTGRFRLEKNLPVAAGIGGGSSDAAAALRLLARCNTALDNSRASAIAARLGSDVPACLAARPVWLEGAGENLTEAGQLPLLNAVLVNPGTALATSAVFAAWDKRPGAAGMGRKPLERPERLDDEQALLRFLKLADNDLEPAANSIAPEMSAAKHALSRCRGCLLARMSGSGATLYGLFENSAMAEAAARNLARAYPAWWTVRTRLNAPGRYRSPPLPAARPGARSAP